MESSNKQALVVTSPAEFDHHVKFVKSGPTAKAPACGASFHVPSIWAFNPKKGRRNKM